MRLAYNHVTGTFLTSPPCRISCVSSQPPSATMSDESLFEAARTGNVAEVRDAIRSGANPNCLNSADSGRTPLMSACEQGHVQAVQMLLSNGANPSVEAKDGTTAAHVACHFNRELIVLVLAENDGDFTDSRDKSGACCSDPSLR
jgi:hypothetical protein